MFSRPAVAFFALAVAELFVLTRVISAFGAFLGLLVLVGLSVLGFAVLRRTGVGLVKDTASRAGSGASSGQPLADRGLLFFASLLMIVPGFLTGLAGLVLLLPPVRGLIRPAVASRVQPWAQNNLKFGRVRWSGSEVVDVDVVDVDSVDVDSDESDQHKPRELN